MQEQPIMGHPEVIQGTDSRLTLNLDLIPRKPDRAATLRVPSLKNQHKEIMQRELRDSLQRLGQLEEQNTRLKQEFSGMKQTAQKLMLQKEILAEKLEQKIQNINQLQNYLEEEHEMKTSQLAEKIELCEKELADKKYEIEYLREEYKEELKHKEDQIDQLNQLLEHEREKADQLLKSDFNLNERLNQLENQNFLLEKELADSQISLFDLRKSLADERIKDIQISEEKILSQIQVAKRVPTLETETDTTYAIHTMEEKIQRLKEINKEQKQKFRTEMENMRQFYEGQLDMIRIELAEQQRDKNKQKLLSCGLKNKTMSIGQNRQNVENILEIYVPLKEQIYEVVGKQQGLESRRVDSMENRSVFTQKYFSTDSFIFKHKMEDIVDQDLSIHQYSPNKISLVESRQASIRSNKRGFTSGSVFYIIAIGALALYATKKILQTK